MNRFDIINRIGDKYIQTFLTTHSAHIANTMDFSKIRYAKNPNLELFIRILISLLKKMSTIWKSSRNTLRLADATCSLQIKLFLLRVRRSGC